MSDSAKREYPMGYLTLSKFGKAVYFTPVHWDAEKRELVWENDVKLYGPNQLQQLIDGKIKSVPMRHSKPIEVEVPVEVAAVKKKV